MSLVTHKYTPAEMSEREFEATFAARGHTVDYLLKSLRDQGQSGTLSSFVITGPRGAGKSTIIRMVALRIRRDPELSAAWIPVELPEEQFAVSSLRDLLAIILENLASTGVFGAAEWLAKVKAESNDEQSQQLAVTGLKEIARQTGARLVVFVENLDQILEECFTDQMKATLRRLLMTEPFMMLVGSSVHVFDSLKNYDEAFFNYFGQAPLGRLSEEHVFELLKRRAEFDGNGRFLREFPGQQPKVRAIVHLSGGNPRLTLMLYELLSQRQVTSIIQHLRRLVDELTPLLKDEINNLPPQQRKVIHALMEQGGTAQPSDLVEPTRLPLNAITAQLRRLKQSQMVEVLGGGKGRAAYYTVPDKLFAIWYQMRYLNRNRRRIEMFVEVLRVWFEAEERLGILHSLAERESGSSTLALHETALAHAEFAGGCRKQTVSEPMAYIGLGHWCAEHEDVDSALKILNPIIESNDATTVERAGAFLERGWCQGTSGDRQGALADFGAVAAMAGAAPNQVADALLNRGVAKGMLGDSQGAIADYTAVVNLEGAPKEPVTDALFNRGIAKWMLDDSRGAMDDFTAVMELEGAPKEQVAMALLNRGVALHKLGDRAKARQDWTRALEDAAYSGEALAAAGALFKSQWLDNERKEADETLSRLQRMLEVLPIEERSLALSNFLAQQAASEMRQGWIHAWRRLSTAQPPEVRKTLGFLDAVCAVLDGGGRSALDPLPPEERDFAIKVLSRFDPREPPSPREWAE